MFFHQIFIIFVWCYCFLRESVHRNEFLRSKNSYLNTYKSIQLFLLNQISQVSVDMHHYRKLTSEMNFSVAINPIGHIHDKSNEHYFCQKKKKLVVDISKFRWFQKFRDKCQFALIWWEVCYFKYNDTFSRSLLLPSKIEISFWKMKFWNGWNGEIQKNIIFKNRNLELLTNETYKDIFEIVEISNNRNQPIVFFSCFCFLFFFSPKILNLDISRKLST